MSKKVELTMTVNGNARTSMVEPRMLLGDYLRETLKLTGTHFGCEHGVCGACTVLIDGEAARSCLTFAVQADGCDVTTVEGLGSDGRLGALQESFWANHALQCGFCTPGFLMTASAFLRDNPNPTEEEVRDALSGNICRCTGYKNIVQAVLDVREEGATRE